MNLTSIKFFKASDTWQDIKNATMNTIGKEKGVYPSSIWKRKLLMAEHSPIRKLKFSWRWENLPYWVSVHFVRHKIGIEHFVKTQRTDRTGTDRTELPQGAPVNHECEADAQAMINISRKRLCNCASPETRAAWQLVKDEVAKVEPEVASCMVRECVYRGQCPEMFPCGFYNSPAYKQERSDYVNFLGVIEHRGYFVAVWKYEETVGQIEATVYDRELLMDQDGNLLPDSYVLQTGIVCYAYKNKEDVAVVNPAESNWDKNVQLNDETIPSLADMSEKAITKAVNEWVDSFADRENH